MALGGIPVSGGITGNGTLLGTNLLREPIIWTPGGYVTAVFALGGTAGSLYYEAKWVKDGDPKTKFITPAGAGEHILTMIADSAFEAYAMIYGVVIFNHNLTTSNITLAKFECADDTAYDHVSGDLVINAATGSPAYFLLPTPAVYKYNRLRIQFNASTALQIGEAFLIGSPPLAFTRNFNWQGKVDEELGEVVSTGRAGIRRRRTRWTRYWREFGFSSLSSTQLAALVDIARNGYCVFSPEGANGYALLGDVSKEPASDDKGGPAMAMRFIEVPK
jgi:hypothetical protein